jgi:hypothetical protein
MNKTLAGILVIAALIAYGAWNLLQPESQDSKTASPGAGKVGATSAAGGTASGATATAPPVATIRAKTVTGPARSALALEFDKGRNLKQFYDRYMANPEGADAETKFFAAAAIETCQWRTRNQPPTEADKARFLGRLKENDPNNAQRIEAYNQVTTACEGFQGLNLTAADASRLYKEAAAAGNPAAKVAVAAELFREQSRGAVGVEQRRMTEDQLSMVRDALSTGDPIAIQRAGMLLTFGSTQLADRRIGPNGEPFNTRDLGPAWTFSSCDHGGNCGTDNARLLNGCAFQGACGYQSVEAYMQFNELSPNAYVAAQQYRAMINEAIAQGRWDWLGIAPGMGRTVAPTPPAGGGNRPPAKTG